MACPVIATPSISFLPSGHNSVEVLAGKPSVPRRPLLLVCCRTKKRLVCASAISQPRYFSSLSFPVRIFNQPSSSSGGAIVIAFLVSSVVAALTFILKSRRNRRISERKIVSYDGTDVQSRSDHAEVYDESLLGMSFSKQERQEEQVTRACDSIGRLKRGSVISSLINSSNAFGRGLEPRGLGFSDSLIFSSPFWKTPGSEFGEGENYLVSRDASTAGMNNAVCVQSQLLDEEKKRSEGVSVDKGSMYFQNGVSGRLCNDTETAVSDNLAETDPRLLNDETKGSEEVDGKNSQTVFSGTKLDVDDYADEICDQLNDEVKKGTDMVAEVTGEFRVPLYEESKMVSCHDGIDGDDTTEEIDLQTADDENEEKSRPLLDEREKSEEFIRRDDKSSVSLHEDPELTVADGEIEVNVLKQIPLTMEGETEMRDKTTEASCESTGYHNEEDQDESMAEPIHSNRNPMPVTSLSSGFGAESRLGSSTTDEQEEISDENALQGAMPAIVMGAGILGMLSTGVHGGLEMAGFVAATSFIAYDLLWDSDRKRWWNDITKITNREELSIFLKSRNIINDV